MPSTWLSILSVCFFEEKLVVSNVSMVWMYFDMFHTCPICNVVVVVQWVISTKIELLLHGSPVIQTVANLASTGTGSFLKCSEGSHIWFMFHASL